MALRIFYSWQSDSPAKTNRNFIEDALKQAIKELGETPEIVEALRESGNSDEALELDKDTSNIPGTPPIVETILTKIEKCGIFVPDLTFVAKGENNRVVSNPNVLIEYGWALAKVGHARIMPIINTAYGELRDDALPFDMRHLRWPIAYNLPNSASSEERGKIKKQLVGQLKIAIQSVLTSGVLQPKASENNYQPLVPKERDSSFLSEGEVLGYIETDRWSNKRSPVIWHDSPQLFLRVIPRTPLTLQTAKKILDAMQGGNLQPFEARPFASHRSQNSYGAVVFEAKNMEQQDTANRITQVSKYGEIWGIDGLSLRDRKVIPYLESFYLGMLEHYLSFAKNTLHITSPVSVIAGLTGVNGYSMSNPPPAKGRFYMEPNATHGICGENKIVYKVENVSLDTAPLKLLQPFFEQVWETCGINRPEHLPVAI